MPNYLNVVVMLLATLAAFVALAKLAQHVRTGRLPRGWRRAGQPGAPARDALVALEGACVVDGKRRLISLRCGEDRVFVLTGGPADLVVAQRTMRPAQEGQA